MSDIKSMGLYRNVERVRADLAASGFGPDDPVTVDDLTPFDQYHYEGTDAVDDAIASLSAGPESHVLDVGSGLGGPARYIADRSRARVTALELQPDLDATARQLTAQAGLEQLVTHRCGDVLLGDAGENTFTGIVSMLCFLHIPDRDLLFRRCAQALRPGGRMFIDDYATIGALSPSEEQMLADTVFCSYLPDVETYRKQVEAAGYVDVTIVDKTPDWTAFVTERLELFRGRRAELEERYDEGTVTSLDHFYSTVVALFDGGNLGGVRLTARRPE